MALLFDVWSSFFLGLLTPLTAVCVLPLYPAFIAFLSNRFSEKASRKTYALFGLIVVLGVLAFMLLLGLIFTTILQESLNSVIGIVSPIAFGILAVVGVLLVFNVDFSRFLPKMNVGVGGSERHPLMSALIFGFFFGAIVIPCNPGFIAAFFARALLIDSFVSSMSSFLFFGLGLGAPLLIFTLVSVKWSQKVIGFLTKYKRLINVISGIILIGIAIYYVFFVFRVLG
jgi:cytochrome c-type biogenesis protein